MQLRSELSNQQIKQLTLKSDWRGGWVLLVAWAGVALIFYIATVYPHPLVLLLALPFLAGRQLALTVIMHECGHRTLFEARALNEFFGQYFAGQPTFGDLHSYAASHALHHKLAGTADDPDLVNYRSYPVDKQSFKRKVWRDITGQTGFKLISIIFSFAAGAFSSDQQHRQEAKPYVAILLNNLVFAVLLGLLFAPWAYLLWIASFMTFFMLIVRIRQVAEHAHVRNALSDDPRNNTRTTIPRWWERPFLAPNYVNYHMEHHFLAGVPCYRLATMHKMLLAQGALDEAPPFQGYGQVLRHTVLT